MLFQENLVVNVKMYIIFWEYDSMQKNCFVLIPRFRPFKVAAAFTY